MALPKFYKVVQDQQGNIVPQVLGSVFNHGTAVLASLYQDDAGTLPLSNPMTSDAQYGSFKFYVNPGHYDLTFTKPGYTFEPIDDMQVPADVVTLGTMATQNANAVAITGGTLASVAITGGTATGLGDSSVTGRLTLGAFGNAGTRLFIVFPNVEYGLTTQPQSGGTAAPIRIFNAVGTQVGSITNTDTATAFNTSSDGRLKDALTTLAGALDVVRALRPVAFQWKADGSPGVGFVAQEVQPLVPDAVAGTPDAVDAEGQMVPMGMDLSKLVPYLTGALQETLAQVEALTARVADLEAALA